MTREEAVEHFMMAAIEAAMIESMLFADSGKDNSRGWETGYTLP